MTDKEKYEKLKAESIHYNDGALFAGIIGVLRSDPFFGVSKEIDKVKGSYALAENFSDTKRYSKRELAWQKK